MDVELDQSSICWKKAVSGSACGHGESKCKTKLSKEQERVAYRGRLNAKCCASGTGTGWRSGQAKTYEQGRIQGTREARLTLVLALLLQRLLKHDLRQPEALLEEVHQGLAEVLPRGFAVDEVAFVRVYLRHKDTFYSEGAAATTHSLFTRDGRFCPQAEESRCRTSSPLQKTVFSQANNKVFRSGVQCEVLGLRAEEETQYYFICFGSF